MVDTVCVCFFLIGYFMSLQEQAASGQEMAGKQFVRFSRLYRSALHECVLGLKKKSTGKETNK